MEAEKIARLLDAEKAVVTGIKTSLFRIQEELANEILKLIELITPNNSIGYAIINGESIVFHRGEKTIIAFVDDDKIMGAIRRLSENV